jgi:hypothetical protein
MRFILAIFFTTFLAACGVNKNPYPNWSPGPTLSPAQQQAASFARKEAWYKECFNAWFDPERRTALAKKYLVLEGSSDPEYFKKMTSKELVPKELVALLTKWQSIQSYCRAEFLKNLWDQDPRLVDVFVTHWNRQDNRLLKAMKGEFKTIGELNEYGIQAAEVYRKERLEITTILGSQMQREVEIDAQKRFAAAQLLMSNWVLTQQQIQQQHQQNLYLQNLMKPPVVTTCNVIGGFINCTTR